MALFRPEANMSDSDRLEHSRRLARAQQAADACCTVCSGRVRALSAQSGGR